MNLERESEPTGFYNHLPKMKGTRKHKTAWQKRTGMQGIRTLKKGLLTKVGYSVTAPVSRRRAAVKAAVKKYGRASTIRKLNAVAVYTRKSSPTKSRAFKKDMKYAQTLKGGATKDELQDFLVEVDKKQLELGDTSNEDPALLDVPSDLLSKAEGLGVVIQGTKNLGNLRNAIERAHDEAMAPEKSS